MKTQSAKAGRNLQKWVVNKLIETFEIHGRHQILFYGWWRGDVVMAGNRKVSFSVECKNVERLKCMEAYGQAKAAMDEPLVIMKES